MHGSRTNGYLGSFPTVGTVMKWSRVLGLLVIKTSNGVGCLGSFPIVDLFLYRHFSAQLPIKQALMT